MCRRKTLLHYFGEEYTEDNCRNCDNCRHPKPKVDARASLVLALEALRAIGDKFKVDHLTNLLTGRRRRSRATATTSSNGSVRARSTTPNIGVR